jgi:hypothetical protein
MAMPNGLRSMSLDNLLRYAHVLAATAYDLSELPEAQAEVDRRLVDAQHDSDIISLRDAAQRLERRRLLITTQPEGGPESDRLLGRPSRHRPRDMDDDDIYGCECMCSLLPPPD